MMMLFQLIKRILIDLMYIFKYLKYIVYFFRFTLFNYGFILNLKNFISKIYYVYILGFIYYIIYTSIYKLLDLFYINNIITKINKHNYFIFTEIQDLLFYKVNERIKFPFYTIHQYDNIGNFFYRQFKHKQNSAYLYLIYSRLTPEVFDEEIDKEKPIEVQYSSAHFIFEDRYYHIYLYDKFFNELIPCLINYIKYNLLNWKILSLTLKKNIKYYSKYYFFLFFIKFNRFNKVTNLFFLFYFPIKFIISFILKLISFFYLLSKLCSFILHQKFKFSSLYTIPRERLIVQSYLQGFQGNIYLENASLITESITYNILNLFIKRNFVGSGSNHNTLPSHRYRFPILDYNITDLPLNPKINYLSNDKNIKLTSEWKTRFYLPRFQMLRNYLNIYRKNYLIRLKEFKMFLTIKNRFIHLYSLTNKLIFTVIFFFFKSSNQLINKSIYIYKIQQFVDNIGWFSFFLFLIIAFDSFIYIYIYLL